MMLMSTLPELTASNRAVVLVAAPTLAAAEQLAAMLAAERDLDVRTQVVIDGHVDPSGAGHAAAQLVIADLGDRGGALLNDWDLGGAGMPLIVIGPANDAQTMRRAMQLGARDYLSAPLTADVLLASVRQVLSERVINHASGSRGKLTAVITAKGGSGGSFVACNLAHILTAYRLRSVALIDMDLQFGALPLSLDLHSRDTLFDAIAAVDQLDPVALTGYMTKHDSGLHVLGAISDQLAIPSEVSVDAVHRLLDLALQTYQHVVVDLPRQIDALTTMVLGAADHVLVVSQQSFSHLRDTKRMFELLQGYVGVPPERLSLVVNRYIEKNPITTEDIRAAVRPQDMVLIPNDFVVATEAQNLGVPVYDGARTAPLTRALCAIAERIDAGEAQEASPRPSERPVKRALQRVLGMR
jgi:pilus assembly protein CpaE